MRWLSNSRDGRKLENNLPVEGQTQEDAQREWLAWTKDKIIGRPKATKKYTVQELEADGWIGLYARD